jgi:predicted phosphodiesterase
MKIAVFADIHANRWALEAVLKSIEDKKIKKMVNLGDCLYGPLDPAGTARILMDLGIPTVLGNEDRLILDQQTSLQKYPSLPFVRSSLGRKHLKWLKQQPRIVAMDCLFYLCHGTPERDDEYLLKGVGERGAYLRTVEEVEPLIAGINQPVILCGHSHIQGQTLIPGGPLIINPGSVGLPAYTDDLPFPHKMESGNPHARYAVLHRDDDTWETEFISVAYDWDTASKTAAANGRPDWAYWLKTGSTKNHRFKSQLPAAANL